MARLRKLVNDHASNLWDVSALGFGTAIAASGGELNITALFPSDAEIADVLAQGKITLSSDNKLVIEDDIIPTLELTDNEEFVLVTQAHIAALLGADGSKQKRGSVAFTGEASKGVTFTTQFDDAAYQISLTIGDNITTWWSSKANTGFTINVGAAYTGDVDWTATRT